MKKLIFLLLLLSPIVHAVTIYPLPVDEGFFAKVWRCTWHISCYKQKLGATLTNITSATLIKDYPTIQNTNNNNINAELLGVLTPARFTATSTSASSSIAWGLEIYERPLAVGTTATTTIRGNATSSFSAGISTTATLDVQSTSATSTFSNGIRLVNGCITMPDGNCALTTGVSGSGSANQLAYFSASTILAGDSDFTINAGAGELTSTRFISTYSTSTHATSTTLRVSDVASTSQLSALSFGVGRATTTSKNVEISGDVQIDGKLNVSGDPVGAVKFLATHRNSVTRTTLTSGTFTDIDVTSTTTPDVARFVVINATITCDQATAIDGSGCIVYFRRNGYSGTTQLPRLQANVSANSFDASASGMFIVPVDSDEIFEYDFNKLTGDALTTQSLAIDTVGFIE